MENDKDIEEIFGKGINDLSFKNFMMQTMKEVKIDLQKSQMEDTLIQYEAFLKMNFPEYEANIYDNINDLNCSDKSSDIKDETVYFEQMRQIAKQLKKIQTQKSIEFQNTAHKNSYDKYLQTEDKEEFDDFEEDLMRGTATEFMQLEQQILDEQDEKFKQSQKIKKDEKDNE